LTFERKEHVVKRSRFTEEQIAFALKQQELGTAVEEICRGYQSPNEFEAQLASRRLSPDEPLGPVEGVHSSTGLKPQLESTEVQNKMGAKFDQQIATWSSLGKTLIYSKRDTT
jgi:hypothetical protein